MFKKMKFKTEESTLMDKDEWDCSYLYKLNKKGNDVYKDFWNEDELSEKNL